ncbi:phosphoribosylanthranilate isomerase [Persicitalea jodogahamensis]|uniref:N-(5'-phosphoribosyl)anthranilate isomerase n=1 Tax=Persicitalea jodogahamensis TaxID=402147 RepID=A0A8J3G7Y1_9BACT|nr:phosphoribosylanthranilate isomerase [Persicitalea jodogahamensis]GHB60970.1 N-(5'-phosphoribosyl)anthranilate isomerase [Persicitalea jodogahamensis]
MRPTLHPRVKICCISSVEEAKLAIDCGASALGLVGNMPSGPGIIEDSLIKEIARAVPPPIATFLLTSETNADGIIDHYRRVHTSTIQLVDALTDNGYEKIRTALPGVKLVQVIHVIDDDSIKEAIRIAPFVHAILLDSGNPNLEIKELGGTGRTHDWELSKKIREQVDIPVFLAGGLQANNVRAAIDVVHPFGLDLCSGVRTNGKLDRKKLVDFFEAVDG